MRVKPLVVGTGANRVSSQEVEEMAYSRLAWAMYVRTAYVQSA